jgi:glycosyltransferase involved in cell wall biosynthesis
MTRRVLLVANTGTFVGGGQMSLMGLVDHLDRERFEPYVVCPEEGDFSEALLERGIPTLVRRMPSFRGWSALRVPFAMSAWLDLVRRYRIELLHADGTRAMMHAGPVGRLTSVPVLWHVRVLGTDGLLDRALARIATRVLVNSHAVAHRFDFLQARASSRGPEVIHNGVDLEPFKHARPDPALRRQWRLEGKLVLASLAQLIPWKRQDLAIEVLSLLRARGVDATLLLIGDEVPASRGERARLEDIAKRRQVRDHCVFTGFRRDVPQVLKQADLLLHTGCNEAFGRALVEAMASSLAVVAAHGGGVEEVVLDGVTGVVVRSDSPVVWAETIARLYRDQALRRKMGAAGRRRAEDHFSVQSHVAGVEHVYEEVLSSTQ